VTHERTAFPFTCTVHAPHCDAPQPNFVPVSFSSSRITHSSGVLSSAFAETGLPLRLNATIGFLLCGADLAPLEGPIQWRRAKCGFVVKTVTYQTFRVRSWAMRIGGVQGLSAQATPTRAT